MKQPFYYRLALGFIYAITIGAGIVGIGMGLLILIARLT